MLRSVPPNSTVVGVAGKVVIQDGLKVNHFEHTNLPDPVTDILEGMQQEINRLKKELTELRVAQSHCL